MGLAFAGSKPTMMTRLFGDTDQPFYSQARRIELAPLSSAALVEVVHNGFRTTGRNAGPTASAIASFGSGHPQRSMELADAAWWITDPGTAGTGAPHRRFDSRGTPALVAAASWAQGGCNDHGGSCVCRA